MSMQDERSLAKYNSQSDQRSINMSIAKESRDVRAVTKSVKGTNALGIDIAGTEAKLHHFLMYKPHTKSLPDYPVQKLFDFWQNM